MSFLFGSDPPTGNRQAGYRNGGYTQDSSSQGGSSLGGYAPSEPRDTGLLGRINRYLQRPGVVDPAQGVAVAVRADAMVPPRPVEERLTDRYNLPPSVNPGGSGSRPVPVVNPSPLVYANAGYGAPLTLDDSELRDPPAVQSPPRPEPPPERPVVGRPAPATPPVPGPSGALPVAYASPLRSEGQGQRPVVVAGPRREEPRMPVVRPVARPGTMAALDEAIRLFGGGDEGYRGDGGGPVAAPRQAQVQADPLRGPASAPATEVHVEGGQAGPPRVLPQSQAGPAPAPGADVYVDDSPPVRPPGQPAPPAPAGNQDFDPLRALEVLGFNAQGYADRPSRPGPEAVEPPRQPLPLLQAPPPAAPERELPHPLVAGQSFQPDRMSRPLADEDDDEPEDGPDDELQRLVRAFDDDEEGDGIDDAAMERIVERVQHELARRLEMERERRGEIGRW